MQLHADTLFKGGGADAKFWLYFRVCVKYIIPVNSYVSLSAFSFQGYVSVRLQMLFLH